MEVGGAGSIYRAEEVARFLGDVPNEYREALQVRMNRILPKEDVHRENKLAADEIHFRKSRLDLLHRVEHAAGVSMRAVNGQ